MIELTTIIRYVGLFIFPHLLFLFGFYLDKLDLENWVIRKYIHSFGLITAGIYAVTIHDMMELINLVILLLISLGLLSLPPIRFLQNITRMGTREGESQLLLLINGLSTSLGVVILVLFFFDTKWLFLSAILCVAIGDGLGEFIGRPWGKHKYRVFSEKSIEGSIGVFFGSLFGGLISVIIFSSLSWDILLILLLASFTVTIIEAVSVMFLDNIAMQVAYAGILWLFLLR